MTRSALLNEIPHLPAAERLRLVEDMWDSLGAATSDVPTPEWQPDEVDRRVTDPSEQETVTADELKQRLP